jgi:hypothetical protein
METLKVKANKEIHISMSAKDYANNINLVCTGIIIIMALGNPKVN